MVGSRVSVGSASSVVWPEGKVMGSASSWWEAVLWKMPAVAALMEGNGRRWGWGKIGAWGLVGVPRRCGRVTKPILGVGGVCSVCRGPRGGGVGGAEWGRGVSGSERRRGVGGSERRRGVGSSEWRRGIGGSERGRGVGGFGWRWGRRDRRSWKVCGHGRGPCVGGCVERSRLGDRRTPLGSRGQRKCGWCRGSSSPRL